MDSKIVSAWRVEGPNSGERVISSPMFAVLSYYSTGCSVGNFVMSAKDFYCLHDAHWMEVIKFMEDHQISIAPLIDEKGIIRKIFLKPKSKQHTEEILDSWTAFDK